MNKKNNKVVDHKEIARFLYEVGTLRKTARSHRQTLLTDDLSDNIASHSYRVTWIGWFLAQAEQADPAKVVMMCLMHDTEETRSNDHNWIHKRYIKKYDDEIRKDQFSNLPFANELESLSGEYEERKSLEAKIAKDADLLDQILLLKEYIWAGNKEAEEWLDPITFTDRLNGLSTASAKKLFKEIIKQKPSDWWRKNPIWTNKNR